MTMTVRTPYVSVCLPVYNGELYIHDAIASVLQQSFEDFELIISDNASTDKTADICHEFTGCDDRVRYFRSDVNCGIALNHNRAFKCARGRYSMWFGHDDLLAKEYLGRCIEAIEQDRELVLCFTNTNHIDDNGNLLRRVDMANPAASDRPSKRFQNTLHQVPLDAMVYGLIRTEVLNQTFLHGGFEGSDRVLLAELALRGRFGLIPDYLFARRLHPLKTSTRYSDSRELTLVIDPTKAGKIFLPVLLKAFAFLSAIHRAKLPARESYRCYKHLLGWLWQQRFIVKEDVCIALNSIVRQHLSLNQQRKDTSTR